MTADFITKRPHKKSRAGCLTCKTKKIKCDEKQPKCSFCELRRLTCSYTTRTLKSQSSSTPQSEALVCSKSASSSPSSSSSDDGTEQIISLTPGVQTSGGNLTTFDLRLMHHYSMYTWRSLAIVNLPDTEMVLQTRVPELAFENDFLMHAILGMTSLHLQTVVPDAAEIRLQTDIYRTKAFRSFRKALENVTAENFEAAMLMSLLLLVLVSKDHEIADDELQVQNWLVLYKGLRSVIMLRKNFGAGTVTDTTVGPVFRRSITELVTPPVIPKILLDMLTNFDISDPEFIYFKSYCSVLDNLGMLFASLQSDGVGPALSIRAISWPSWLPHDFPIAAKEHRPRALIILAYYLMFLKLSTETWWAAGFASRDIKVILKILAPKWSPYMRIPAMVADKEDLAEISQLVLSV